MGHQSPAREHEDWKRHGDELVAARRAAFDEAIAALQKRYEAYLGVNAITAHEVSQCIVALQFARDGEQDREGR